MVCAGTVGKGAALGAAYLGLSTNTTTDLRPILTSAYQAGNLSNANPSTNVELSYGNEIDAMVNVALAMNYPSVLLEEIDAVSHVVCTDSSVSVTFDSDALFKFCTSAWNLDDKEGLVIITNHMGNCDVEHERGIFYATSTTWDAKSLTVTARTEKKEVADVAASTEISFANVPLAHRKRKITFDKSGIRISNNVSLPASTQLFSVPRYVSLTADEAFVGAEVTFSGKLKFNILRAKLEQLTFDIDASMAAQLGLTLNVEGPYTNSLRYAPGELSYQLVNIPGILKFGPALEFAIGMDVDADAKLSATTDLALAMPAANVHLDAVNGKNNQATGWTPKFTAQANITQKAQVGLNPWVELTLEMAVELFGGALDLSTGVTAKPKMTNQFDFNAGQTVGTGGVGQNNDGNPRTCDTGLAIRSDFDFSLIAFVTQFWKSTVYSTHVPVANECYTWL
ncbi:hypothetical protein Micbo1qcDRAFT_235234 [Microdochium bolleyi]|uniref:Uncharacterized protein n=1 Tax=Microdochium bolleyi TaxID=196109 RepID=A0A136IXF2_9PEZI|nr:hypothetical protein Micbo1qcDRAFT_235234 [Microdochium bolleyi]